LIFALSSESAGLYSKDINSESTHKTYHAIVRGFSLNSGIINTPLKCADSDKTLEAETKYETLRSAELPFAVGKRHTTARYSLVKAEITTGRYHQIRRHLASIAHPIIGDANHGDLHHNKFFREVLKLKGLQLRATNLSFVHPYTGERININAGWNSSWEDLFSKLQWPH
jgi:tRNA pseudouridine65 synthase